MRSVLLGTIVGAAIGGVSIMAVMIPEVPKVRYHIEDDRIHGTQFDAEGKTYTADHATHRIVPKSGPDIGLLGESKKRGYEICKREHPVGASVRMPLAHWPGEPSVIQGIIMGAEPNRELSLVIRLEARVALGFSGSPILCAEHNGVIGVLSRMNSNDPRFIFISQFYPEGWVPSTEGPK